ncbi:hypothetical protein LC040_04995 [Bacillus tianshenii]|nr:hypothetical protein LC040_04995 [Bacillus tianshenii]
MRDQHVKRIEQELRQTQQELSAYLQEPGRHYNLETVHYIQQELADVNRALAKLQEGSFGMCEYSGQTIPMPLLEVLPTARTIDDVEFVQYFRH